MRDRAHTAHNAVPADAPVGVAQLSVKGLTKSYGTRIVLDQVSFTVRPGEKAAVIGENGSGKSTLLRLLAAAEMPDTGRITVSFPGGTGHLAQTPDLDADRTVQDAVDLALAELRDMERRLRLAEVSLGEATEEDLTAYGELLIAFEERGGYQADARVDAALHGLGLARITRDRLLGSLSGGEQSRLALACVLAAAPELLLLDEPTNHLDAAAVRWLEEHLRAHRGTVVAVTHDRGFVERVATTILEVDRDARTVFRYGDGWPATAPRRPPPGAARSSGTRTGSRRWLARRSCWRPRGGASPLPAATRSRVSASTAARTRRSSAGRCAPSGSAWPSCGATRWRSRRRRSASRRRCRRRAAPPRVPSPSSKAYGSASGCVWTGSW